MPRRILLINGANLNLLGTREPEINGSKTLADVLADIQKQAAVLGLELDVFQSNHEGAIIDRIQQAGGFGHLVNPPVSSGDTGASDASNSTADSTVSSRVDAIIINPGGFTHTSVVICDALLGVRIPFVELHISNVHARESWRRHSYFSDKAAAVIAGLGTHGYTAALEFAGKHLKLTEEAKSS